MIHYRFALKNTETDTDTTVSSTTTVISDTNAGRVIITEPTDNKGYGGPTPLRITLDSNDRIQSVELFTNQETPAFVKRITDKGFFNSWNGLSAVEAVEHPVEAITGSTMTTRSVINTLRDDIDRRIQSGEIQSDPAARKSSQGKPSQSVMYYVKSALSIAVLLLALLSFFFPKQAKPGRVVLLGLSVIVLGFWQGQYLSITHFFNWSIHGFSWTVWFISLMALLAVLLPLVTGKSFYCVYVCPFGAAQELVSKLNPKHRLSLSDRAIKILKYIQPIFFAIIILGVVSDFVSVPDSSVFEPFLAFLLSTHHAPALIIAGISLIVSTVLPKFWCKYVCPAGFCLNLMK
ncbi:hypothetical protein FACS1894201_09320 [Bacteroidia bacterium]|nr:hypothetical protein FACS1894201_09320 [Bacteroidia bacterium]